MCGVEYAVAYEEKTYIGVTVTSVWVVGTVSSAVWVGPLVNVV